MIDSNREGRTDLSEARNDPFLLIKCNKFKNIQGIHHCIFHFFKCLPDTTWVEGL